MYPLTNDSILIRCFALTLIDDYPYLTEVYDITQSYNRNLKN